MLGRDWHVDGIASPSFRATKQERPQLFACFLFIELAILAFLYVSVLLNHSFWEIDAIREFIECRFGEGLAESCY